MKKLLILIILVIIGYYFWNNANTPKTSPINTPATQSMTEEEKMKTEMLESSLSAELLAVGLFTGSGTATTTWNGSTFTNSVMATLPSPPEGKFYEGWLVRNSPELTFISTGKLELEGDQYVLKYTSETNYPNHIDIVVTLETSADGLDNKPEAHVLEGALE